jgi:molybdenum cofactor cytidylyltransferase
MSLVGVGGVILAAGESSRMGRDKALLPWPTGAMVSTASASPPGTLLSAAIQSFGEFCDMVIVVAGKNEPALRPVVEGCGAVVIRNPAPERGQFSSLQTGLREVLDRGRDAAMITLVDRPPPQQKTLANLVTLFAGREHGVWAVVPEYSGTHGHPILIGREMIEAFLKAPATANARDLEHRNQARVRYIPVDDPLVTTNIDTPQEYDSLKSMQ